jgi:guanosine-3',5'-bis(diphosphate) 3'-pyrophosphohydrolase
MPIDSDIDAAALEQSPFAALQPHIGYLDATQCTQLQEAYLFAAHAHEGQTRSNGHPYITHPVAVAVQCAQWHLDLPTLMAALLHDVIEDCHVKLDTLTQRFGPAVAQLVNGLTKLDKLADQPHTHNQSESFRKMLLAMAQDWRVILIKLADRSHNIQTLHELPRHKWSRIAHETLDIYAPIAHRLGLWQTYMLLQEYAFKHAHPWRYRILAMAQETLRSQQAHLLEKTTQQTQQILQAQGLKAQVYSREKSLYAIYKKMAQKHRRFAQITDVYGLRIVVHEPLECYLALGLIHQRYQPVPGRFKDHIALAKRNGYQSLHTTVLGPCGAQLEFQIRTERMHHVAQTGLAAHWQYKVQQDHASSAALSSTSPTVSTVSTVSSTSASTSGWLQSLLDIQQETPDAQEFWEHIKVDLSPDAMYVLTPNGRIMALPKGACVIDFAYALHTSLGDHMVGARVNGQFVKCRALLRSGDVVEVLTHPQALPQPVWLAWVRTGRARSRIRHHIKTLSTDTVAHIGEQLLHQACQQEGLVHWPPRTSQGQSLWPRLLHWSGMANLNQLWLDIGLGKRQPTVLAKRLHAWVIQDDQAARHQAHHRPHRTSSIPITTSPCAQEPGCIRVTGLGSHQSGMPHWIWASCCQPLPGEAITAYLGHGEQLEIHLANCPAVHERHLKQTDRFLNAHWSSDEAQTEPAEPGSESVSHHHASWECVLTVHVHNEPGALAQVATALTAAQTHILHIDMGDELAHTEQTSLHFVITVKDAAHWQAIVQRMVQTPCVQRVHRGR